MKNTIMRLIGKDPWKNVSDRTVNHLALVYIMGIRKERVELLVDFCHDKLALMSLIETMKYSGWKPVRGKGKAVGFTKGGKTTAANSQDLGRNLVVAALEALGVDNEEGKAWEKNDSRSASEKKDSARAEREEPKREGSSSLTLL